MQLNLTRLSAQETQSLGSLSSGCLVVALLHNAFKLLPNEDGEDVLIELVGDEDEGRSTQAQQLSQIERRREQKNINWINTVGARTASLWAAN